MKPKSLFIFLLIALLPVIILAWMGVRIVDTEKSNLERGLENIYLGKLKDHDATIQKVINKKKRELVKISSEIEGRNNLPLLFRDLAGKHTSVSHFFILNKKRELIFPSTQMQLSQDEKLFLQRTKKIWEGKLIPVKHNRSHKKQQIKHSGKKTTNSSGDVPFSNDGNNESVTIPDSGWITWFWESGIHLIYWIRLDDGRIFGAELDRSDLIADIIAELPGTDPFRKESVSERIILVNVSGKAIYQWGTHEIEEGIKSAAVYPLSFPLSTWKLKFYPDDSTDTASFAKSSILNLSIMLSVLGIIFIFLAIYFYRENSREMREAATRVSFVNRVSHELKTPLTNIRMYAELLNSQIEDMGDKEKKQLAVIIGESERLSRLISNVLTFSKEQQNKLRIRKKEENIDKIVSRTVERFSSVLKEAGIELSTSLSSGNIVNIDSDILEQILINLLSNIEKYAASGGSANIATKLEGNTAIIIVSDAGQGISAKLANSIFQPFYRIDNKLSEGASGTGIGLSIARELARKHGGDIRLVPSEKGAFFEVRLDVG